MKIYLEIEPISELPDFIDLDLRDTHYSKVRQLVNQIILDPINSDKNILINSINSLYAFNNCQMRYIVDDKIEEYNEIISNIALPLSPLTFFSIDSKGIINNICEDDGTIEDNPCTISLRNLNVELFCLLNYYEYLKQHSDGK